MDKETILKAMFIDAEVHPEQKEQLLKCFPRGKHFIEKYNETVDFNDEFFASIADAFNSPTLARPYIDKDHEMNESYGDILEPVVQEDGMYFKVLYNDDGINMIKNNRYNSTPLMNRCIW